MSLLSNVANALGVGRRRQQGLAKAITNTGWLMAERGLRLTLGLFIWLWIARYLGPYEFGTYAYVLAFVGLFGVLATLGMDRVVVRDLVHDPSRVEVTLGSAFLLRLVGGTCGLLLGVLTAALMRPDHVLIPWFVTIAGASLVLQAFGVIDLWFQSRVIAKYSVWARSTAFVVIVGVQLVLIRIHASLIAFFWAVLAEAALAALGLLLVYAVNRQSVTAWRVSVPRLTALLRESWPLIVSGVSIMIYMRIDQVMIGALIGDEEVGIYSAATRVSEVWYFIPMAIVSSVTPSLIAAKKVSEEVYYGYLRKMFLLMAALALAIAIPITFVGGWIIDLLFGQAYSAAGPVLAVHIWAAPFVFLGVTQSPWTINEGLAKLAMARTVLGAIVNIILNFLFIPKYGALGAAFATVISQALSSVVANAFDERTHGIFYLQVESLTLGAYRSGKQ